jgi:hypothetical protein
MIPTDRSFARCTLSHVLALLLVISPGAVSAQAVSAPAPIGDTVTTASGLRYVYLQRGNGARPDSGDLVVLHGQGRFTDGTVIWDTRKAGDPFEYTYRVDGVIKGFLEGMGFMRAGDRVVITMKPELAYGSRNRPPIPPNSTLIFDYEVLGVYPDALPRLLRDGFARDGVDATLARLAATPDLWRHYASESGLIAEARRAGAANPADYAKVLEFALTLAPMSYRLHQALAGDGMTGAPSPKAVAHFEAAMRFNPRATEREAFDYEAARRAVDQVPYAGGGAAIRRLVDGLRAGNADYSRLVPELASALREQSSIVQADLAELGALQALTFQRVGPGGADIYEATFANGKREWRIQLGPDGTITSLYFEDPPAR